MVAIRRVLAFPFYFAAVAFHLLTAFFTVLAQKVAGDDMLSSRAANIITATVIVCTAGVGLTLWGFYALEQPIHPVTLAVRMPFPHWKEVPTGFSPQQEVWARPLIKLTACVFAQRALRNAVQPAKVGFDPCGDGGKIETTMDDKLYEMIVSGVATIDGKKRPFKVALNHYPPSVNEWGFIATDIQIRDEPEAIALPNQ